MQSPIRRFNSNANEVDAWEMVRRWPGMRGEDKLAWLFLWQRSRGGLEKISITAGDVGLDQGVTSDAGRQRIKNLIALDLVLVSSHERLTGVYVMELADPRQVARARAIKWDPQLAFGFLEGNGSQEPSDAGTSPGNVPACDVVPMTGGEHDLAPRRSSPPPALPRRGSATEEPPEVPRRGSSVRPFPLEKDKNLNNLNPYPLENLQSKNQRLSQQRASGHRGSSGGSSAGNRASSVDQDEARFLEDADRKRLHLRAELDSQGQHQVLGMRLIAQALERGVSDPVVYRAKLNAEARIYKQRVGCQHQYDGPCLKLADAVLSGVVKATDVEALFADLDRCQSDGRLRGPRSSYFNAAARKLVERAGLKWIDKPK